MKLSVPQGYLYLVAAAAIVIAGASYMFFVRGENRSDTFVVQRGGTSEHVVIAGTVKAAQDVDLGFAQSGRVSAVYAKVGDVVRAWALLAEVENGDLRALVAQRKAALSGAEAKLAALMAGTRPEAIAVTRSAVVNDNIALIQADQALADAIRSAYTVADGAVRNTLDEFISSPRSSSPQLLFSISDTQTENALEAGRASAETLLLDWQADLTALTSINAVEHVSLAQSNLGASTALVGIANLALNKAVPSSSASSATLAGWTSDVASARASLDKATSALTTAQTARAAAAAALDRDQKTLALQEAGSTQEDIEAQDAAVDAAQADVESAQAQLRKTLVTAPFSGIVTKMDAKVGEVVNPGVSEISMISSGVFQIECFVSEVNIASIAVGDKATAALDAYPGAAFNADVIAVDPGRTEMGGVSTYKTTLQFAQPDPRIREGMTANVDIAAELPANGFAIPAGAVFRRDGMPYVQVVRANGVADVAITTGDTALLGQVFVTDGLREGDTVLLTPDTGK